MPTKRPRSILAIATAALYAGIAVGPCPAFAATEMPPAGDASRPPATKPGDLLGRWILSPFSDPDQKSPELVQLDVVRCGKDFCGIKVSAKGACAEKILSFKDTGDTKAIPDPDKSDTRFIGTVDWKDPASKDKTPAAKYYVTVNVYGPDAAANPDKPKARFLAIGGYPATDGVPTQYSSREFPFGIEFEFVGPSSCNLPAS